jgi:very-short-patch-repair endonuclease
MRTRKEEKLVQKQLHLEQRAWVNRRCLTASEARLWSALRARKLGVQFRREVPLAGRYIVDFAAPAARLIVEVDGSCHVRREATDRRRDRELEALGWRVVRVEAEVVMRELGVAVALVTAALK